MHALILALIKRCSLTYDTETGKPSNPGLYNWFSMGKVPVPHIINFQFSLIKIFAYVCEIKNSTLTQLIVFTFFTVHFATLCVFTVHHLI